MAHSTASIFGHGALGFFAPLFVPHLPFLGTLYNDHIFEPAVKMFMDYLGVSFGLASTLTVVSVMLIGLFAGVSSAYEDNDKEQKAAQAAAASSQPVAASSGAPGTVDLTKAATPVVLTAPVPSLTAAPQPTSGRVVAYRVMQFLMGGWTLLCAFFAVAGMFNVGQAPTPCQMAAPSGLESA